MKIYKLKPDTDYRFMYPEDTVYNSDSFEFKCELLADKLPQFEAYFDKNSDKPTADIAYLGMSTFALKREVADTMADILEDSAELLPFTVNGDVWYCLNVTNKSDALDVEKSKFKINKGDIKIGLTEPFFDEKKLPKPSLFKIIEDNYTEIYCVDKRDTDDDVLNNFFCALQASKYKGIKFEEIFSTE